MRSLHAAELEELVELTEKLTTIISDSLPPEWTDLLE
jgi:hypothetical protein